MRSKATIKPLMLRKTGRIAFVEPRLLVQTGMSCRRTGQALFIALNFSIAVVIVQAIFDISFDGDIGRRGR